MKCIRLATVGLIQGMKKDTENGILYFKKKQNDFVNELWSGFSSHEKSDANYISQCQVKQCQFD